MVSIIRCSEAGSSRSQLEAFQHVEHLDQQHAAGRRRRHRDDRHSRDSVPRSTGALDRAVVLQIVRRHQCRRPRAPPRRSSRRPGLRRTRAVRCARWPRSVSARSACTSRSPRSSSVPSRLRKIFAVAGQRANIALRSYGQRCRRYRRSTGMPSRASTIAGAISCASVNLPGAVFLRAPAPGPRPCRARRSPRPRSRDFFGSGSPLRVEKHVAAWSPPARSRDSRWRCCSVCASARWITMKPPPPILPARG